MSDGRVIKYAELRNVFVRKGDILEEGQVLGRVGRVIDKSMLTDDAPDYVKALSEEDKMSMLHLELYLGLPQLTDRYLGGNLFSDRLPKELLDPTVLF